MQIAMIPQDYIICTTQEYSGTIQTDFVIKAVKLKNKTGEPLSIKEIAFELFVQGEMIKQISYKKEALNRLIDNFPKKIKSLDGWDSQLLIGREMFWDYNELSEHVILLPNQETGIINEFFIVICENPINELNIIVSYIENGVLKTAEKHIPVIEYRTKNKYIFPAAGVWQIYRNYDSIGAHRTQYSMEFAFDIGQLNPDSLFVYKSKMEDEDFVHFGKDILAIAGGIVVESYNNVALNTSLTNAGNLSREELEQKEKIITEAGNIPVRCGNYIIIKHDNDEYSLYGHLLYNSLTVKTGDIVERGQVIGRIGNTGRSSRPHLHFQLMNKQDYLSARGLPCHFTNIVTAMNEPIDLVRKEYTIVLAK